MMSRIAPRVRAHELRLGRRRKLEVHPAQRALAAVERDVGLGDRPASARARRTRAGRTCGRRSPRSSSRRSRSMTNAPVELGLGEDHVSDLTYLVTTGGMSEWIPFPESSIATHSSRGTPGGARLDRDVRRRLAVRYLLGRVGDLETPTRCGELEHGVNDALVRRRRERPRQSRRSAGAVLRSARACGRRLIRRSRLATRRV